MSGRRYSAPFAIIERAPCSQRPRHESVVERELPAWFLRRAATPGLPGPARLSLVLAAAAPRLARTYLPHDPGALEQRFAAAVSGGEPTAQDSR